MKKDKNSPVRRHVRKVLMEHLPTTREIEAAAKHFKVDVTTIYNWRSGHRGLKADKIVELSKYFGITTDEFIGTELRPGVPEELWPKLQRVAVRAEVVLEMVLALEREVGEARAILDGWFGESVTLPSRNP